MPNVDLIKWKQKRSSTYVAYVIQYIMNGLSYALIAIVLWPYLKSEVYGGNKFLYYGLISSSFNVPAFLFSIPVLRWTDRTRNAKQAIIIGNLISALGHLLFSIPFSPLYLVFGRLLDGVMPSTRAVITAEMARSYPPDELQVKLPLLVIFVECQYAMGAVITIALGNIDAWLGDLHLSLGNSCSLLLCGLSVILVLVMALFSHNLSKEYDLKRELIENQLLSKTENANDSEEPSTGLDKIHREIEAQIIREITKEIRIRTEAEDLDGSDYCDTEQFLKRDSKHKTVQELLIEIISDIDTFLLLLTTLLQEFWESFFFRLLPYLIVDALHYSKRYLSYFYLAYSLSFVIMTLVLVNRKLKDHMVFYLGISSFISLLLLCLCTMFISKSLSKTVNCTLLSIYCVSFAFCTMSGKTFLVVTFAKMLRSEDQGVGESFRVTLDRFGSMLGALLCLYIYTYFRYASVVLIVTVCITICLLVLRRASFSNPRPKGQSP